MYFPLQISDDKSTLIIAKKDYESQTVPAVCIDVKAGKKMSKITVKDQRIDLRPEVTALSPDGKLLYLAFVSMIVVDRVYRKSSIEPPGGLFNFGHSRGGLLERGAHSRS